MFGMENFYDKDKISFVSLVRERERERKFQDKIRKKGEKSSKRKNNLKIERRERERERERERDLFLTIKIVKKFIGHAIVIDVCTNRASGSDSRRV